MKTKSSRPDLSGLTVGERIRLLRIAADLSQGDIEERTGLLRCYISRVENGHTVPAVETLEKLARAMNMKLYEVFYDGEGKPPKLAVTRPDESSLWGHTAKDARELKQFRELLSKMSPYDRATLIYTAGKMAQHPKPNGYARPGRPSKR